MYGNIHGPTGGQSIPALDYYLAPGIAKTYISEICKVLDDKFDVEDSVRKKIKKELREKLESLNYHIISNKGNEIIQKELEKYGFSIEDINKVQEKALKYTEKETYQAMEALVHNLNSIKYVWHYIVIYSENLVNCSKSLKTI